MGDTMVVLAEILMIVSPLDQRPELSYTRHMVFYVLNGTHMGI